MDLSRIERTDLALSTPIINTLADVYGLTRFLRFEPWDDWVHFKEEIVKHEKTERE